jgi:uncharacterized membrane protein
MTKEWNPFGAATWIAWLGATVFAALTITVYAYAVFETKEESKAKQAATQAIIDVHHVDVVQRMDRMENKVDQLLEKGN